MQARIDPSQIGRIGWIDGKPLYEYLPGSRRSVSQRCDRWPRCLGVHVVRRNRRDATPIVQSSADKPGIVFWREIRRRLNIHTWAEYQPRNSDGPQQIVEIWLRRCRRLRIRFGAEVLYDHFLNVAEAAMEVSDREQGFDTLQSRFANANQNPGSKRHPVLTREPYRLQSQARLFVW